MLEKEFSAIFRPFIKTKELAEEIGRDRHEVAETLKKKGLKRHGAKGGWGYVTTEAMEALGVSDWYRMMMEVRKDG